MPPASVPSFRVGAVKVPVQPSPIGLISGSRAVPPDTQNVNVSRTSPDTPMVGVIAIAILPSST